MQIKRYFGKFFLLFLLIYFCFSCQEKSKEQGTVFKQVFHKDTGIDFSNDLILDDKLNVLNYIYYFNGGGVAAGDINNDGFIDLFFTGNQVSNELYLNKGNLKFENYTKKAGVESKGWSSGATMVDINADGWLDIYVCKSGSPKPEERKNLLYINQKDGTFKEEGNKYGLDDISYSTQAAFFDYDLDGDLDMYLLNHMHQMGALNQPKSKKLKGESENTDKLYQNEGIGADGQPKFIDVSSKTGITIEGFGLGIGISDINHDGLPDIYVSNDFVSNDILYMNQGDGTFKNRISEYINHQSHNGMGNDLADINNDGLTDILVMDMLPSTNERRKKMLNKPNHDFFSYGVNMGYEHQYMRNTLQLNQGTLDGVTHFGEIGQFSGISSTDWSWAGLFADYDLDGNKDLFVTNGYLKDMTNLDFINYRRRQSKFRTEEEADSLYLASINRLPEVALQNFFFKNNGDLTFANVSTQWAPKSLGFSNGAVYADLDNDGDLDIITNNINEKASVLKNTMRNNETSGNHFLSLHFKGSENNTYGIGAKIWVYSQNGFQYAENYTSRGFQSAMAPTLNFGFKSDTTLDSLKIEWAGGKSKTLYNLKLDTQILLSYTDAETVVKTVMPVAVKPFIKTNAVEASQKDLEYSDYRIEPLLPRKFSNDGPAIAVSDINGDGLDDFFIGGSYTFSGKLFVQLPNGAFKNQTWEVDPDYEDMGSLFFDADGDGDEDLYVVSGSNEFRNDLEKYQDRLYLNNGKGKFTINPEALPENRTSGSCVIAADYDKDGQLDLFVGGRVIPDNYGGSPKSYLLKNKNGRFFDVTKEILGEDFLGMVTSALWTDVDNNGWVDLILVGEWMPITVFMNDNGNLSRKITLENSNGWWNSINGGDFDNDGDIDYIVGNLGENSIFKADVDYPMELHLGDFNRDGRNDPIITCYSIDEDGKKRSYPFVSRDLLSEQMNFVKSQFKFYEDYAKAQINDIIPEQYFASAQKLKCNYLQSAYVENTGGGRFKIHALPKEAQLSPVMGTTIADFNLDGNLDVLLVGNFYHAEVGYGQYDASKGLLLTGNGNGNFLASDFSETGFLVDGDARSLVRLSSSNSQLILAGRNNNSIVSYVQNPVKTKKIVPPSNVEYAIIKHANGKKTKLEFYRGEGYLSQSSRTINLPMDATITWGKFKSKSE